MKHKKIKLNLTSIERSIKTVNNIINPSVMNLTTVLLTNILIFGTSLLNLATILP